MALAIVRVKKKDARRGPVRGGRQSSGATAAAIAGAAPRWPTAAALVVPGVAGSCSLSAEAV